MKKKIFCIILILAFSLFGLNNLSKAQNDSDLSDIEEEFGEVGGEESGEIALASGGSLSAKCSGNVPFRRLTVKNDCFNSVIVDPETGNLQITIDAEKETDVNILNFKYTLLLNPADVINKLLKGATIPLTDENIKLSLSSTNFETGETVNVANEVRKLVEGETGPEIDELQSVPLSGAIKIIIKDNLASGFFKVVFTNTNRVTEKASEVIGEPITIDENGKTVGIGKFSGVPINGSFTDLAGIDPANLPPKLIEKLSEAEGIDINNLPPGVDISQFAPGINIGDLTKLPVGFTLMDLTQLPEGFMIEDLNKIPPGFGPADLGKLPPGFNLNDFLKVPPDLDLSNIPPGFTLNDLIKLPFGTSLSDLPPGFAPEDIKNIPPGFGPEDIKNLPPGFDPNNLPPGITPGSNIDNTDPSVICENGQIKPGFESFLPPGFQCPP